MGIDSFAMSINARAKEGKSLWKTGDSELKGNILFGVTLARVLRKRNSERRYQDHSKLPLKIQLCVNLEFTPKGLQIIRPGAQQDKHGVTGDPQGRI